MKLLFRISSKSLVATYHRVKQVLDPNDQMIFDAMAAVTAGKRRPFATASNPGEFAAKHQEVEKILKSPDVLGGRDIAIEVMEELFRRVKAVGGVPGISTDSLLDTLSFETNQQGVKFRLSQELRWVIEWPLKLPSANANEGQSIILDINSRDWGEIVPSYVVEYISSAITAYEQGLYATAVALISIATEATLRDVLQARGYSFSPGASSVDVYKYTKASVGVVGNDYTLTFRESMPKSAADFIISLGNQQTVEIEIRRVMNRNKPTRIDLAILAPLCLIDHWSLNTVVQPAQKKVNGLGEAFDIARNQERFLTPQDLPLDLDDVIQKVRNNLIHLSGDALSAEIPSISDPSDPSQPITLGKFLESTVMVYDFMTTVPAFINQQYVELRKSGSLAP